MRIARNYFEVRFDTVKIYSKIALMPLSGWR